MINSNGYESRFKNGATKFDQGGKPNPLLLPMINEGMKFVLKYGVESINKTLC